MEGMELSTSQIRKALSSELYYNVARVLPNPVHIPSQTSHTACVPGVYNPLPMGGEWQWAKEPGSTIYPTAQPTHCNRDAVSLGNRAYVSLIPKPVSAWSGMTFGQ